MRADRLHHANLHHVTARGDQGENRI